VDPPDFDAEWRRLRGELDELARVEGQPGPSELRLLEALSRVEDRLGPSRYIALEDEHRRACEQAGIPYRPVVFYAKPRSLVERCFRMAGAAIGLMLLILCAIALILTSSHPSQLNPKIVNSIFGVVITIVAMRACILVLKRKGR
jgi:hypothetical protein